MSKRFLIWGFAVVLVAAFAGTATADVPRVNVEDAIALSSIVTPHDPIPASEDVRTVDPQTLNAELARTADAGCQVLFNTCELGAYIFSIPGTANARIAMGERMLPSPGFLATPCSVKTMTAYLYDWIDGAIQVDVDYVIYDDAAGVPGTELARVTIPAATVDANITADVLTEVDFSSFNLVIPAGDAYHCVVECPTATPGTSGIFILTDEGSDDPAGCGGSAGGSVFYTDVGFWETNEDHFGGWVFNAFIYSEACCEAPPPDCFTLTNTCEIGAYIFSVPGTANARIAMAEGWQLDPIGARECTLKAVTAYLYDWIDGAIQVDVDFVVYDDAGGVPGTELARVTVPAATVDANIVADVMTTVDFSSFNLTAPSGGILHAAIECPTATPGTSGIFILTDEGSDDPACGGSPGGSVFYTDVGFWETNSDHFGGWVFNAFIYGDICCPPLLFDLCTPAADADWETQGNGFARTNASTASISNLCALQTAWSAEFDGQVMAIQPIIAGDFVLVTSTDSLHCFEKLSGVKVWSFGGFPYIVGDVRGAPTVDLANDAVYVGGAGAQAFSRVALSTGLVVWSRNLGGVDPPVLPLNPGQTNWTPSVLAGGNVYFTQETGWVYCLDAATGLDVVPPVQLPDAPGAVPYNALTSDGVKLWIGTGDAVGTAGNIHQLDAATLAIDWTLSEPGIKFWGLYPTGDSSFTPFQPEGFPGSMAYENGILYYHSLIREDATGFAHFPQTGGLGAIDVAAEDGTGAGILWVNDAGNTTIASPGLTPSGSYDMSGPAVGPGFLYLTSRGFFGGVTEQDGVSAWSKTLGSRIWYAGYTGLGVSGGVGVLDDVRCDAPATVICQPDGTPYVFTGHVGGTWRLYNANTGALEWYRTMSERVRGTAVGDDCVATVVRTGGPVGGGGALMVFTVGNDRARLQIDSQYVFRTATPGDGVANDIVTDALQNTGCVDLTVVYGAVAPPDPVRVTDVNPNLAAASERGTRNLGGYDALLDSYSYKARRIARLGGIDEDESGDSFVRTFASNLGSTADPLFVTAVTGPATVGAGATASIDVTYDETGLTNNTGYTNFIELETNDPDYYPQDPTGAILGLPSIQFELFIGCPDAQDFMNLGNAGDYSWVTNFGAEGGGGNFGAAQHEGIVVNGNDANHFDGGWALVVTDSVHWAFDGCSSGGYPRRAGEWGPTLPCGLTINALQATNPLGGQDDYEEVSYNMIDLASTNGFFPASSRQCGGWLFEVQRVSSQDPEFGMFLLTKFTLTNEAGDFGDLTGDMSDIYFGGVTDWDISSNDVLTAYADGYAQEDGGAGGSGNGTWLTGHVRLDGDIVGAGPLGSGGAPTFMSSDIQDDQGRGNRAFDMLSDPANYGASVDPASTFNTDLAALMSLAYYPTIADGASETFYFGIYMVENGEQATWSDAAGADAAYADVACRMKGFAGFGKGDVNCDGVVDLADVVALGNILDGISTPAGGAIYTSDVDGNNAYEQADYDLLYDVVAGVQPASAMANAWRF